MKKVLWLALVSMSLLVSSLANSAIITANGMGVNALSLNGQFDTFEQFYDYRLSNSSSHTGYEIRDRVVVFFATLGNETALIVTAGGPGGFTGKVDATVKGTEGGLSFIDDPAGLSNADPFDGTTINWSYSRNKNDGFIYKGLFSQNWTIDLGFTRRGGGVNGYDVLTFDESKTATVVLTRYLGLDVQRKLTLNSVSAPAIAVLLSIALVFVSIRAKR